MVSVCVFGSRCAERDGGRRAAQGAGDGGKDDAAKAADKKPEEPEETDLVNFPSFFETFLK